MMDDDYSIYSVNTVATQFWTVWLYWDIRSWHRSNRTFDTPFFTILSNRMEQWMCVLQRILRGVKLGAIIVPNGPRSGCREVFVSRINAARGHRSARIRKWRSGALMIADLKVARIVGSRWRHCYFLCQWYWSNMNPSRTTTSLSWASTELFSHVGVQRADGFQKDLFP